MQKIITRIFDLFFSIIGIVITLPIIIILTIIGFFDTGSPFFKQIRVGKEKSEFSLIKFRTMKKNTPSVASHLASVNSITKFGAFLRKTKLDELPQLINVLKGDMSIVGPRPCLFDQDLLIAERDKRGVFKVKPGITGLAQISGIDMSDPKRLAEVDLVMLSNISIQKYLKYILLTILGKGQGDRVVK